MKRILLSELRSSAVVLGLVCSTGTAQLSVPFIDGNGDGVQPLLEPQGVAVDDFGNVFVTGHASNNVFKIAPDGTIKLILNALGDGQGNPAVGPWDVITDPEGNAYVTCKLSHNAFKIEPNGTITEIISRDGTGIRGTDGIARAPDGTIYVSGRASSTVWKILPTGDKVRILGPESGLEGPTGIALDTQGNVFISRNESDNVFKVPPGGPPAVIVTPAGAGTGGFINGPDAIDVDSQGNVYVAGRINKNILKVTPDGTITEVFDDNHLPSSFIGERLWNLVIDDFGVIYFGAQDFADNDGTIYRLDPGGELSQVAMFFGSDCRSVALDSFGNLYSVWSNSNIGYRHTLGAAVPALSPLGLLVFAGGALLAGLVVLKRQPPTRRGL